MAGISIRPDQIVALLLANRKYVHYYTSYPPAQDV